MNGLSTNSCIGSANEAQHTRQSNSLLEGSRRIDWRFLLPNPKLGHVAYLGAADDEHLKSLELFCASLTKIKAHKSDGELNRQYDVVVVSDPNRKMLRGAAKLVRPGGFLYAEVYGLFSLSRLRRRSGWSENLSELRLRYPAGQVATTKRLGFIDIQTHWHWPNFQSCTKIIPLNDQEAMRYAFAHSRRRLLGWLQTAFGHWSMWNDLFGCTVPCFSVVASRSGQ